MSFRTSVLLVLLVSVTPFYAAHAFPLHMFVQAFERMTDHQASTDDKFPTATRPADLPEPDADGARILVRYCQQCHALPSPAMHSAEEWPAIVERMNARMQGGPGHGMMRGMMGHTKVPAHDELAKVVAYLRKHGQQPLNAAQYPDLAEPRGQAFQKTCSQCHALPDPKTHRAEEWPGVVSRMKQNMSATGKSIPDETTLKDIEAFLQQHARVQEK